MILVTGATGFVGSTLLKYLSQIKKPVRVLLHPSPQSPKLPVKTSFDVAVSSFHDPRGLQASLKDVDTIFHLASAERSGEDVNLTNTDVIGTEELIIAAKKVRVKRFIFLSHIGADRNSIFPVLKAKALAENVIQHSGINFSIFRSSIIFGPNDHFTTRITHALRTNLIFFPLPGDGKVVLQPLWIHDLVTCLVLSIDHEPTYRNIFDVGGGEYFSLREIIKIIINKTGKHRILLSVAPAYIRTINLWTGGKRLNSFFTNTWLDYLVADHTCALDTLPKLFGLLPARFEKHIDYLVKGN